MRRRATPVTVPTAPRMEYQRSVQVRMESKAESECPFGAVSGIEEALQLFSTAVKDGVIAQSPCFDIDLFLNGSRCCGPPR
jgi:hypothetical protein